MPRRELHSLLRHVRRAVVLSAHELTDAQLVERYVRERDKDAFATLVHRHGGLVRSVCRHVLEREQDVDDSFQATFLVFASKAATIRRTTFVASWLYGVAYRTAMNAKRSQMRHNEKQSRQDAYSKEQPVMEAALRELQAILAAEMNHLPEKYRAPFVLCALEGKSRQEAARELGCKEGTVSSRLARARQELQRRLERRGIVPAAALCALELEQTSAAPAVAPALLARTIDAGLSFAAGKPIIAANASADVSRRAQAVLRVMGAAKRAIAGAVLLVAAAVIGVGVTVHQAFLAEPVNGGAAPLAAAAPADDPGREPGTQAVAGDAVEGLPRKDRYGDPLPAGAIARLGTRRFHGLPASVDIFTQRTGRLALLPDGKTMITGDRYGDERIVVWDLASGKELRQIVASGSLGAVSADGKLLAGWTSGTLALWDIASGKQQVELEKGPRTIDGVAFSGDGKLLIGFTGRPLGPGRTSSGTVTSNNIYRWNTTSGNTLSPFRLQEGGVTAIALSPAGTALAAGDDRGFMHLLDPAKGDTLRTWQAHEQAVLAIQLSDDGKVLATSSSDSKIRIWHAGSGRKLQEIDKKRVDVGSGVGLSKGPRTSVPFALSGDGKTLVAAARALQLLAPASFPAFEMWDVATGEKAKLESSPPLGSLQDVAFSADGRAIATLSERGVISLWDRNTGRQLNPSAGHELAIEQFAVFPDGKRAVTRSWTSIRFWDLETGKELFQIDKRTRGGMAIGGIALSPDGAHLAMLVGGRLSLWDTKQQQAVDLPVRFFSRPVKLAYSPDGTKLATADMVVFDTRTWTEIWSGQETGKGLGRKDPTFSSDGRFLATSSGYTIDLWNAANGKLRGRVGGPQMTGGVKPLRSGSRPGVFDLGFALSPDSRMVAANTGNMVYLWETATGQERGRFQTVEDDSLTGAHSAPFGGRSGGAVAFSPDGKLLVFGENAGSIHAVDLATGNMIRRLPGHSGTVTCLAFSADGRYLFSAGRDTTVLVWDVALAVRGPTQDKWRILAGADAAAAYQAIGELAAEPDKTLLHLKKNLPGTKDRVLALRTLEVLERIATAEARRLLDDYARDGSVNELRPQAQAAADRLKASENNRQALSTLLQSRPQLQPPLRKDQDGDTLPAGSVARLGTTRFRLPPLAPQANDGTAFLDDRTLVVSGGRWGTVRFVDLSSGKETTRLAGEAMGSHFALSPDGRTFAAATFDTFGLWDLASRRIVQKGDGAPLAFSPDGKLLAVLANPDLGQPKLAKARGYRIFLWNIETKGTLELEGSGPEAVAPLRKRPQQRAAFSPDGKLLAGRTADSHIQLWDVRTGKPVRKWSAQGSAVSVLGFTPGGEVLATSAVDKTGRANIVLWDPRSGKHLRQLTDDKTDPLHTVLSPDAKQLAASSVDRIDVWEVPSGKLIRTIAFPGTPGALAFSRDGQTLASVTNLIRLWDMKTGKQLNQEEGHTGRIDFLAVAPDGSAIVSGGGGTVHVWDDKGQIRRRFGPDIAAAVLSADGKTLVLVAKDLHIWDLPSGKELPGLPALPLRNPRLTLSPNGRVLAVEDGTLSFWDLLSRSLLWKIDAAPRPPGTPRPAARQVAFSADGKQAAVWDAGSVRLHDAATGKGLHVVSTGGGYVSGLALSADGRSLVLDSSWVSIPFAAGNVPVVILETATGKERFRITRPSGPFALSADGHFLALGMNRPSSPFALSPDGPFVGLGNSSGEIQVIELPSGKTVRKFQANGFLVSALAFSADGRFLFSGSADTSVLVWDMKAQGDPSSPEKSADPWTILAGSDPARAYRTIRTMAHTPDTTVAYLQGQLARHHLRLPDIVWKLIANLDSDDFKIRSAAAADLIKLGGPAELALEQSLRKTTSLETRRRIERVLEQLSKNAEFSPEQVALLRAFEVLEKIGTPKAQRLLETFSVGGTDARLRVEARVATERLKQASRR